MRVFIGDRYMVTVALIFFLTLLAKQCVGQQATSKDTFVGKEHKYMQPKLLPKGSLADLRIVPLQDASAYPKTSVLYNAANFNGTSGPDVYLEVHEKDRVVLSLQNPEGLPCTSETSPIRLRINDADICGIFIWWSPYNSPYNSEVCKRQGRGTLWKRRALWSEHRVNLEYDKSFTCGDTTEPSQITILYECYNTPICPNDPSYNEDGHYTGSHQAKITITRSNSEPLECNTTSIVFEGKPYDPEKSNCSAEPVQEVHSPSSVQNPELEDSQRGITSAATSGDVPAPAVVTWQDVIEVIKALLSEVKQYKNVDCDLCASNQGFFEKRVREICGDVDHRNEHLAEFGKIYCTTNKLCIFDHPKEVCELAQMKLDVEEADMCVEVGLCSTTD